MTLTVLTESELRQCVELDAEVIEAIADAFSALAKGRVVMPPVLHMDLAEAHGEVDVKTAWIPDLPSFAIKVSPGFFDNPGRGLPSLSGMMMLLSATTGRLEALHLDNGYLTEVRTAAAGAVAARHLAGDDARTAGVLGAGVQARLQLDALIRVRPIERVLVWAREGAKADAFADEIMRRRGLDAIPVGSAEKLVLESDVIVCATASRTPLVVPDWLQPGLHITAMGADAPDKNELHPGVLERADLLVCDSRAQCARLGELHHALEQGIDLAVTELGEITSGARAGRTSRDQITVCDLTGTGVQDTAIAHLAYHKARARGLGTTIEN
ncbi:MAG TPA: cyclodeaminase [Geminicoccaceae bacterium]|nr:cyclodeaminase [Geminicoccaceae bacterium]